MKAETLWVPFSVLNAWSYSANTRLVWLLLDGQPRGNSPALTAIRLGKLSGLDPETIARARARLVQAPLAPCYARPQPSCAAIPAPLLTDENISAGARLLYGQLQAIPGFAHPAGSFTYAALSHLTGSSDEALRRAVAELVAKDWLAITQANRKSPVCFTLRDPVAAGLRARISAIRRKVRGAQHRGQALLCEFLNATVALDECKDNASPDFLLNPYTGELMELDRYYPAIAVAFEFNGDQHYEETNLSTFEDTVKQVGRDAMKAFICKARGIQLVTIHPEDLTLKAVEQKIPECLPRRDPKAMQPLIAALEELGSEYRQRTAEERARKGPRPGRGAPGP